jgi:hypothetical protein
LAARFKARPFKHLWIVVACLSVNSSTLMLLNGLQGFLLRMFAFSRCLIAPVISNDCFRELFAAFVDKLLDRTFVGATKQSPFKRFC